MSKELREALHIIMIDFARETGDGYIDRRIAHLEEALALFDRYAAEREREAMAQKLLGWLEKQDAMDVMHFMAITIYLYVMEPTNATEFKTKLEGFNRGGEVLGDFTISAALKEPSNEA